MNKTVKRTLIAGAILICLGLVIVLAIGITSGWKITSIEWEEKTFETENDDNVSDIMLDFDAGKLKVEFYDGETIKVEYSHSNKFTTECEVVGRTLNIATTQVRWFNTITWFNKIPTTKIYIPNNMKLGIKMIVNAGSVSLGSGAFGDVDIKINAGAISIGNVTCAGFKAVLNAGAIDVAQLTSDSFSADVNAGAINVNLLECPDVHLDLSAGSADIGIAGKKSDYTIKTDVSAGGCNVSSQSGGSKKLVVEVSAGSANIVFEE